jgi:N-methylhydantoinase A/oxoprolinase/acetone carboxylase beta subunit/N-methylhydantoinase B/oxoprolinase/acetone carboxylase alpha subunit
VALRIGVDIGGTFTDLVALDEATGAVLNAKALSTPQSLLDGVLRCVDQAGARLADTRLVIHGTTIGINALLEGKGARTGLITTDGFRDVLEIGRGNYLRMYDVLYRRPTPLVPRGRCLEVPERLTARGEVLVPLDEAAVRAAARRLAAEGVQAVALVFLFSYRNPVHEQRAAAIVAEELPGVAISVSHRLTQEWREYERTSTTVVNAYLLPIVDRYLGAFGSRLGERGFRGRLLITQSNGGAFSLEAARAKPVHTIESGPAAGAVGCAALATVLGLPRLISFDMGGTTAKCAIVEDGMVQTTDEYHVDGRPLRIPVIDIREVSAGGGTIAWIDAGGALTLGPQSAGAEPGPVCYALGGREPTVTDANVVLGRIDGSRFLGGTMPLDAPAADRAIDDKLAQPLGLARLDAAAGVVRLADVKMALAVRSITANRGLDPRDYALAAYGGGGPLHAVAIARELGIPRVVIPPAPSTFSAWGMLATDLRHDLVRTVLEPLERTDATWAQARYAEMEHEIAAILPGEGQPITLRAADLRYLGQEHTVTVALAEVDDWDGLRKQFDDAHERAYGYAAPDVEVQLLNLRLTVVFPLERPALPTLQPRTTGALAFQTRAIYSTVAQAVQEYRVFQREHLHPGDVITGPAAVEEPGTTTIIEATDTLSVEDHGCLIIHLNASEAMGGVGGSEQRSPQPITIQVIRAALNAAAETMRLTMIKTAYNHIISESLDFGCAIFDADVQMIAQGIGLPVFQGHLGFPIEATIQDRGLDAFREGDVFIHNDPYAGNGNHLNDVAMTAPVFWEGQLTGFVSVKAHWTDVGGPVPSSMQVGSREFRQEGLRFQSIRLFSRGEINEEVMRLIRGNIRTESGTLKDVQAMIAVCRTGETSFHEILTKYGRQTVLDATRVYMEQSERRTRAALGTIPAGIYQADGTFDNDGITLDRPVRVAMAITVGDGAMTVDFTDSDPQVAGPFNCGDAITISACRLLIKCLTTPHDLVDEGCFRPLRVVIPRRSVLAAEEPAPTARYYVPINLLIELGLRALSSAIPDRVPAGAYGDQMPTIAFGTHPETGRLFIQGDLNAGGTGARPTFDGESAMIIFAGSTARNNPVEVVESRLPLLRILRYGLRTDSGGAGKFRGGLGIEREYEFLIPAFITFSLERKATPPWGLAGGQAGAVNGVEITSPDGSVRHVRKATQHPIAAGERVRIMTGGGGGLGAPTERDPEAVRRDVHEGYVSAEAARRDYGITVPNGG